MEIIIGKNAGFCYGVEKAVETTKLELEKYGNIFCLGELVHNSRVVKQLEESGLKTIEDIEETESNVSNNVIIRAHGVSKQTYEKAKKLNINLIDLTCPNVLKIHKIVEEYANNNYFIIIIGSKKHPETIGSFGFAGTSSYIVEKQEDIKDALKNLEQSQKNKLLVVVQTTFSLSKFNEFVDIIKNNVNENIENEIKNTICNATKLRQEETERLAKIVDCMIIIGGKNSSNTKKLYEIAQCNCNNCFLIENLNELEDIKQFSTFNKIGIMAGASTPNEHIEEVRKYCYKLTLK